MRQSMLTRAALAVTMAVVPAPMSTAFSAVQDPAAGKSPETMAALDRMSASLRRLTNFSFQADTTKEDVLTTGQKIQYSGTVTVKASRPNAFRIDVNSARQARSYFFDGKKLTVYAPRSKFYATVDAPGSVKQVVDRARDEYDLDLPLVDLFAWGNDPELSAKVTSAIPIATETIAGQRCQQHALRQENVDWQIWLAEGAQTLPCKLVITDRSDPSMPQYSAVFRWQPTESFAADTFTFRPAADQKRIVIARATE